ncbi:Increased rDNA silencing protein [Mortierella claussenii]|nr:Increased rDNA silencing protein [Mortierella claussenii]
MARFIQAKALFDCMGDEESELTFHEGDILTDVRETSEDGWLHGRLERTGEEGLFPDNYVEIIQAKPETAVSSNVVPLPQLPTRVPASNAATSTETPSRSETAAAPPITTKPLLPARKPQNASPSSSLTPGSKRIPGSINQGVSNSAANPKVALSGLGTRSMYGGSKPDLVTSATSQTLVESDHGRAVSGPPALPRRSNTLNEKSDKISEQNTSPLTVRERMANLSMANQRQISASSPLPLPSFPPSSGSSTALPLRSSGPSSVKELASQARIAPTAVRSPLPSAAGPALPPRSLPSTTSPPSNAPTSPAATAKHVYQVEGSVVPVPKLTTFAKPRSARTGKSSGSPTASKASSPPPASTSSVSARVVPESAAPPKLPSRMPTIPIGASVESKPIDTSSSSGPVRFSPAAVRQAATGMSALPAISRNSQPLPLPSRAKLTNGPTSSPPLSPSLLNQRDQGTSRPVAAGEHGLAGSVAKNVHISEVPSTPVGSVFGVKLNSVGSRALNHDVRTISTASAPATSSLATRSLAHQDIAPPPLPARSSTIPLTSSTAASTQAALTATTALIKQQQQHESGAKQPFPTSKLPAKRMTQGVDAMDVIARGWSGAVPHSNTVQSSKTMVVGTCVAMPPARLPDMSGTETVGVKPDARRRYEMLFRSVTSGDYIEGVKVHAIFVRSRLDSKTLAQIWDLVDVDNAGRLSRAQFCMGLYLIDERLASGLIPLEVSDELWVSVMQ